MLFSLLKNVKMPTTVGILTFMSGKNFFSAELSMKFFFITSRHEYSDTHGDLSNKGIHMA